MKHLLNTHNDADRLDWLRLIRSENVGPRTFRRLLQHFGDAAGAMEQLPHMAKQGGSKRPIRPCPLADAQRELEQGQKLGLTLLTEFDHAYPRHLSTIDDAPPVIWARGDLGLLNRPAVGMVGARNASLNGRNITRRLAADLGRAGLVVVSGLARGIDASAHEGSLSTGTIAVVAELPPGTQPQSGHFPRRNRIVSGLSLGVVVVEASLKSGSLITARQAAEQGREVFAVPGSPLDPRAQGPNDLLRHGATLAENAADILNALSPLIQRPLDEGQPFDPASDILPTVTESELQAARSPILECLTFTPVPVDEIIRQCQLSPSVVSFVLLELELAGRLERQTGNRVSLLSD